MKILAIETSCDDTCLSLVEIEKQKAEGKFNFKILSNLISSQVKIHVKYGGVYPFLAKREHQKNLPIILKKVFKKEGGSKIEAIAVTIGPGLEPCLWTGINFAKKLAKKWKLPILPVNHIEAHIYANFIGQSQALILASQILPALCLIVSGGHTQLILMKNFGQYKILGETRDDAAGECFDKVAKILGLGYPGGPALAREANKFAPPPYNKKYTPVYLLMKLPRPMINQKNYDFSFSGLKTAVLYHYRNQPEEIRKSKNYIQKIAKETQQAIIDVLIYKTLKAAHNYKIKAIILGGGVAANQELRRQFKEKIKKQLPHLLLLMPEPEFCTDNGAMVGLAAYFHWPDGQKNWQKIKAEANLKI